MALLGYGYGVSVALGAADRLLEDHGLDVTVADARFAKPLDAELVQLDDVEATIRLLSALALRLEADSSLARW